MSGSDRDRAAGVLLESALVPAMAAVSPTGVRDFILESRAEIEITVQARVEGELDDAAWCRRGAGWFVNDNHLPRGLRRIAAAVERAVCAGEGGKDVEEALRRGLIERKADGYARTRRPIRWAISAGLNLRVDGVDVAAGPIEGLCALGRRLHLVGYPEVSEQLLKAFGLGEPFTLDTRAQVKRRLAEAAATSTSPFPYFGVARAWIQRVEAGQSIPIPPLSETTAALVRELSGEGLGWENAGKYLGLARPQWAEHAQPRPARSVGRLGVAALRCLDAHPRVVAWMLNLALPQGRAVAAGLLERLGELGLAQRDGEEWSPTRRGREVVERHGGFMDPVARWERRHGASDLAARLRGQLRQRARDAGRYYARREEVRARHVASILRQVQEHGLGDGCELALALWSAQTADARTEPRERGSEEIRRLASSMPTEYLRRFFEEKEIPERTFEIDAGGTPHLIPNAVVVEHIARTHGDERRQIEAILRRLDFANGDINDFLRHLAGGLASAAEGFAEERTQP